MEYPKAIQYEPKPLSSKRALYGGAQKAPLPGVVSKVCATEGAYVQKGELLVVLEAMKMENEIRASCEGRISEVLAHEGDAVKRGDMLVKIAVEQE